MVDSLPELLTLLIALIAVIAEFVHARRIGRVKRLVFGPSAKPAAWVNSASLIRVVALSVACWGFLSLLLVVQATVHDETAIAEADYKHLVLVIDVSPSMHLKDAGPTGEQSRRMRASEIVESVFNRIPMRQFKVTIIGVYSDAKMLVEDSRDFEVVRHIMEEMPLWHAYKPGKTELISGVKLAAEVANAWPRNSGYILMLTDGDTVPATGMPKIPPSVKETFIVGVGDHIATNCQSFARRLPRWKRTSSFDAVGKPVRALRRRIARQNVDSSRMVVVGGVGWIVGVFDASNTVALFWYALPIRSCCCQRCEAKRFAI